MVALRYFVHMQPVAYQTRLNSATALSEYVLPRPLGALYLRFPVRSLFAYFRSKPKAWHIALMSSVFLALLFSCA